MAEDDETREAVAWRILVQTREMASEARECRLDTLAYLLEMAELEAKQHVVLRRR